MQAALQAIWRLLRAYLFYPVMIGIFLWLYAVGAHWIFGLMVIVAILVLDPMWHVIGRNIVRMTRRRK